MVIRNTSRYPTEEVRELVQFGMSEVDTRRVCVNVKNAGSCPTAGYAYLGVPSISNAPPSSDYLIVLRIGSPDHFPFEHVYPYKKGPRWPVSYIESWREGLVHLAAHEAKHIEQFRERLKRSEIACEHFAVWMLKRYRKERLALGEPLPTTT